MGTHVGNSLVDTLVENSHVGGSSAGGSFAGGRSAAAAAAGWGHS